MSQHPMNGGAVLKVAMKINHQDALMQGPLGCQNAQRCDGL